MYWKKFGGSRDIKFRLPAGSKLYQPIQEIFLLHFLTIRESNLYSWGYISCYPPPSLFLPDDNFFLKRLVHHCRITYGTVNNLKSTVSFFSLSLNYRQCSHHKQTHILFPANLNSQSIFIQTLLLRCSRLGEGYSVIIRGLKNWLLSRSKQLRR